MPGDMVAKELVLVVEEDMTAEEFEERFGHAPGQDDLHRVNCQKAGTLGHFFCGLCPEHEKPRFMCGCLSPKKESST